MPFDPWLESLYSPSFSDQPAAPKRQTVAPAPHLAITEAAVFPLLKRAAAVAGHTVARAAKSYAGIRDTPAKEHTPEPTTDEHYPQRENTAPSTSAKSKQPSRPGLASVASRQSKGNPYHGSKGQFTSRSLAQQRHVNPLKGFGHPTDEPGKLSKAGELSAKAEYVHSKIEKLSAAGHPITDDHLRQLRDVHKDAADAAAKEHEYHVEKVHRNLENRYQSHLHANEASDKAFNLSARKDKSSEDHHNAADAHRMASEIHSSVGNNVLAAHHQQLSQVHTHLADVAKTHPEKATAFSPEKLKELHDASHKAMELSAKAHKAHTAPAHTEAGHAHSDAAQLAHAVDHPKLEQLHSGLSQDHHTTAGHLNQRLQKARDLASRSPLTPPHSATKLSPSQQQATLNSVSNLSKKPLPSGAILRTARSTQTPTSAAQASAPAVAPHPITGEPQKLTRSPFGQATEAHKAVGSQLNQAFKDHGIDASISGEPIPGPSTTRYKVSLGAGEDPRKIERKTKAIQTALKLPAEPTAHIENGELVVDVPRRDRLALNFEHVTHTLPKAKPGMTSLKVPIGAGVDAKVQHADLTEQPHMLVAGGTQSGKSTFLKQATAGLMHQNSPEDLKIVHIDGKGTTFQDAPKSAYEHRDIPSVVKPEDRHKAVDTLKKVEDEVTRRNKLFADAGVENLDQFKQKTGRSLPKIVVVMDEFKALKDSQPKDAAAKIQSSTENIARLARSAGVHLILASQRPDADEVPNSLKTNLGHRVALKVGDDRTSRMVLDHSGAENLLGRGDLFYNPGHGDSMRLQSAHITPEMHAHFSQAKHLSQQPAAPVANTKGPMPK